MNSKATPRHPAGTRELRQDFASADRDRDGHIDFEEFVQLLRNLDANMSTTEMRIGFQEIDTNSDGRIDCREFIEWWTAD